MRDHFMGYVRADGSVGVRNLRLALPSVVCANRAALEAVRSVSDGVAIEHPVGCAQIGADRDQTKRVLVGVGAHPNVRTTAVIGLGCEGVPAAEVFEEVQGRRSMASVVTIQSAGGTTEAAAAARVFLEQDPPISNATRQEVSIHHLVLGVGPIEGLGSKGREVVDAFLRRGGKVVQSNTGESGAMPYAARIPDDADRVLMEAGEGSNQVMTGLAASGAQILLAECDRYRVGGHPVVPVIRIGYDPAIRAALQDDMDGMMNDRDAEAWVDWILDVASGEKTMAEMLGSSVFAIARIGPTL